MLEGKVVNGYWEPGRLNRILGRQLECGQRPWWREGAATVAEFTSAAFVYYVRGKKYDLSMVADNKFTLFAMRLSYREALAFEKIVMRKSYGGFKDGEDYADVEIDIIKFPFGWR